ncbi:MAG: UvrD-helicase domain-containing protein [Acidobacteriota bacterium]|nr:UvrD-helicase domain-containing protein [Acidobacteriota bacterium]
MSHWQKIRDAAKDLRREVCAAFDLNETEIIPAEEITRHSLEFLELFPSREHPASNNLRGALACLEDDVVYFDGTLEKWFQTYCIAHEIAHFRLHHASVHCSKDDIEDFAADEEADSAAEKAVGYGAGERREREANLFALELVLPCNALRRAFLENDSDAREIARCAGFPLKVVFGQIARALLVPVADSVKAKDESTESINLDASQKRAAETEKCPVLVTAGPGTGKTQTLTKRISFLLEKGIAPKRILALTFSNKAAEEMRERLAAQHAEDAAQIQVMTFHAFGLDILRSFWKEAGLDAKSNLLDKIDALLFLEKHLTEIDLEHYQNLVEPTQNLAAILGAISRAKDELCSPEDYRILGEKMLVEAEENRDAELKIEAEKVLETAQVYRFYQNYLDENKLLDFGDLIYRAVRLLQENESVKREVGARYDAILVDEFQDVNRACGVLLKEIAGSGEGLWAVGDLRQSIYRWRGASPANLRLFGEDFPNGETVSLENNYRSQMEIIRLFKNFTNQMKAAGAEVFSDWQARRVFENSENQTAVNLEIADELETEAENLAEQINFYRSENFAFKDCAVICRTHNQLNKFADILTAKGVPIFYLGELFEREEVRDLLALLDLKFSANGHSLIRVAEFPEYKIPITDAKIIIDEIREKETTLSEILEDEIFGEKLSAAGAKGWNRLREHLRKFPAAMSAWQFLAIYLFAESDYLKPFFASPSVHNQSRLLAVYQFLRLAQTIEPKFANKAEKQIPEFLNYVKKLAWFNEDKNYAQIPAAAENLDAVRLLTVHSAKGLEFRAVFLPFLGAGKIPSNRKGQTCPNPKNMTTAGDADFHDEEEECLFFVAMSRARDYLHLSRSLFYGETKSNESKFLTALATVLPSARKIESQSASLPETVKQLSEDFPPKTFYSAELDHYLRCPRSYFYANICGLKSKGEQSIYLKFHSCVYETINSLQATRQIEGIEFSEENSLTRLNEFWRAAEIDAHAYAPIYKKGAEEIVRRMCRRIENAGAEILRPTFEVKVSNGAVRVRLDAVEITEIEGETRAVIRKYKTGKQPKKPTTDDVDALVMRAAKEQFPEAAPLLQKIYLSDDTAQDQNVTEKVIKNRLEKYERAIDGINSQKFPATPSDDNCPHCPYFFICPSGD